jgi:hypothetical protein
MKKQLSLFLFLLLNCSSFSQLNQINQFQAAEVTQLNSITTAVPFLQLTPDARASGVGEAGLGLYADANQTHWNPSNLAFGKDKIQVSLSHIPELRYSYNNMNSAYLAVYGKLNEKQAIGGSFRFFSFGSVIYIYPPPDSTIQNYNPNEFAIDFTFSQKFWTHWSGGISVRYIYSDLTGGNGVGGDDAKVSQSLAFDLSMSYVKLKSKLGNKDLDIIAGFTLSNIGSKMYYTNTYERDFLPTNLRLGSGFNLHLNEKNEFSWEFNINKLLVPTSPIYAIDSTGRLIVDKEGNSIIMAGLNNNVGAGQGMIQSFYDAPGGLKEEIQEITFGTGIEYWYNQLFAIRLGYFYEHPNKGYRQHISLGTGIRYKFIEFDFSYLFKTTLRNKMGNTFWFTLLLSFG